MHGAQHLSELFHVIGDEIAGQKHALPIGVGLRHGVHGEQVLFVILEDEVGHRSWRQQIGQSARIPAASRWIRWGLLNQSTATRSFSSACLITQASPDGRSTRTVRLETPPASGVMVTSSSAAM